MKPQNVAVMAPKAAADSPHQRLIHSQVPANMNG